MQKINLLPRWYWAWKQTKRAMLGALVLVLIAAGGVVAYWRVLEKQLTVEQENQQQAESAAAAAQQALDAVTGEANAVQAQLAPYANLVKFCSQFEMVNAKYANVFEGVSRYIWDEVTIESFSFTGGGLGDGATGVSFACELPNLDAAMRFCRNLDRCAAPGPDQSQTPGSGSGTEPLWSQDPYSTAPTLTRLITSWTVNGGSASTGRALDALLEMLHNGSSYTNPWATTIAPGVVSEAPVRLSFSGTLQEPFQITIEPVSEPEPEPEAAAGGMGMMGMMGSGGMMGGGAAPAEAGGADSGDGGDDTGDDIELE